MMAPMLPFQGTSKNSTRGRWRANRAPNVHVTSNPNPSFRRRPIDTLSPNPRFGLNGPSAFRGLSGQMARATARSSPIPAIAKATSSVHQAVRTHRSSWRNTELNSSRGEGHHSTGRQRNRCVQRACLFSWTVPRARGRSARSCHGRERRFLVGFSRTGESACTQRQHE